MEGPDPGEITALLGAWREGDAGAVDRLFPVVYETLRSIASGQLRRGSRDALLDTTGLVHDAYLKLVDQTRADLRDREHFFAVAAKAMRRILIDHARARSARKRGGGAAHQDVEAVAAKVDARAAELLAVDEALERLASLDPRLAKVVELRFFAGLSVEETAELLGSSERTVKRDWQKARAFLHDAMGGT